MGVESMASAVTRGCPAARANEKQSPKDEMSELDAQASAWWEYIRDGKQLLQTELMEETRRTGSEKHQLEWGEPLLTGTRQQPELR